MWRKSELAGFFLSSELINWKRFGRILKIALIFGLISTGEAIKCYECTDPDGTKTCIGRACTGKYCYKADGVTSTGKRSVKKGCVHTGIPGPCKEQSINLPGIEPINGHWCVCDTQWCNTATGFVSSQRFSILLVATVALSWTVRHVCC